MNTQAGAAQYAGMGGWPDPDLLIGPKVYVGGQSDQQARAQFTMWSLFPTNLLISQNMLQWSAYALETYSNAELIAINQDPLGSPAQRVVGGDLKYPCQQGIPGAALVAAAPCQDPTTNAAFHWTVDASSGLVENAAFPGNALDVQGCNSADGTPVILTPVGKPQCSNSQKWSWAAQGTLNNAALGSGVCLDVYDWSGPAADVWECNGGSNQVFSLTSSGTLRMGTDAKHPTPLCLMASAPPPSSSCTNVWGRALSGGDFALGFVNNDASSALNVTCDSTCMDAIGIKEGSFIVRDLWAHASVATLPGPPYTFSALVDSGGFAAAFRLVKQ